MRMALGGLAPPADSKVGDCAIKSAPAQGQINGNTARFRRRLAHNSFEQGEIGSDLFRAVCSIGLEGLVSKCRERKLTEALGRDHAGVVVLLPHDERRQEVAP
jgi:hypothetical protein